jgi:hypothetical protein
MTGVEILFVILLILLVVTATAWVGLYVTLVQSRRRYVACATQVAGELQAAATHLSALEQTAAQAAPTDPPPYGPLVKDLRTRLQRAHESRESCAAQLAALTQTEPASPPGWWQQLLAAFSGMRAWRAHLRAIEALNLQLGTLLKQLEGAQQQAEQMRNLPIGVAGRVRSLLGAAERVTRACQALQQLGVRGDGLDALIATARTHTSAIETLPDYFRQGSNDMVMSRATPESTRDAWQRLSSIEKPLFDALRRAQQWQELYNEAKSMISAMQVEVTAAGRILTELPPSIDAGPYHANYAALQDAAGDIEAAWRTPEVHRLSDLSNVATKQVMATQQLGENVMLLHKSYQGFEQALTADDALLTHIETVLSDLSHAPACPVRWDYCAQEYQRLRAARQGIGDLDMTRNRVRLETDLDTALDLGLQAGTLEAQVNDIRDRHKQLLAWLSSPEFQTRGEWFHEAAALSIDAGHYAAENWQERDQLSTLKADASGLLVQEQALQPLLANEPIAEDDVQAWINQASVYLRERRAMQARLDSIAKTLHAIESAEKTAQNDATQALTTLGKLDQAIAPALNAQAVTNAWHAVLDLWGDGKRLADALEERTIGTVLDKAGRVAEWVGECAQSLRALCQSVDAESNTARASLRAQVDALVAIAPFDAEPSMVNAQQLLDAQPARTIGGSGKAAKDASAAATTREIGALVAQANQGFDLHTRLVEALDELETRILAQVDPRVSRLDEAHAAAWDKLQELDALQRQIPSIKPLQVVSDEADRLGESFHQAEGGLEEMSANGRTVKAVVSRLESLAQQFQYIANQGAGAQADLERDLVRLRAAWDQLSQWMRQLKRYRDWQSNDRVLAQAIDARLDAIDQHFADIQRRYKGRPLPLEHACRELDVMLSATRRDVEVPRDTGLEVVSAQTIQVM